MQGVRDGLLLREHAHRVANDMAVAGAALRLAERRAGGDPAIAGAIVRIDAASRVQRLLCARPVGAVVDVGDLLRRLCAAMADAHPVEGCSVAVSSSPLAIGDAAAMLVAMVVHELVRNALVHACDGGGRVDVVLRAGGGMLTAVVADRGPPRGWNRPGGQGTAIVDELVAALGGKVARRVTRAGGRVEVSLPAAAVAVGPAFEEA